MVYDKRATRIPFILPDGDAQRVACGLPMMAYDDLQRVRAILFSRSCVEGYFYACHIFALVLQPNASKGCRMQQRAVIPTQLCVPLKICGELSGERGIRTPESVLPITRFPDVYTPSANNWFSTGCLRGLPRLRFICTFSGFLP